MKKENNANSKRINWIYIIFGIMAVIQLAVIIYYFQFCKQGYHSDEMWSYGYANSYYQKDIHIDEDGNLIHMNEWLDTQVLKDYIVANEGERFKYDSVYHNQIRDLSPPFHSMILHTISSFFPGRFSRWFSFSINIVSFLICMIYLFKIAKLLKGDVFALCCCALYGFCMGARDTYIYLRMYAMCAALVLIILYHLLQYFNKYQENKKAVNGNLIAICITSLIGFLTHYYMVSFMGILTFFVCVYLLFKKQIKAMFVYGFSMLVMFIASVLIFPAMLGVSRNNVEDVHQYIDYNFEIRFRVLSNFIMKKIYNITVPMVKTAIPRIVLGCLVFALIVITPLLIFLRDTRGMQRLRGKLRLCRRSPKRVFKYLLRRINWFYIILTLTVICQMIVIGETSKVYGMGSMEDRYLFFVYPCIVLIGLAFIYQVGIILTRKRKIATALLIVVSVMLVGMNIYNSTKYGDYLFRRYGDIAIEDCLEGKDCIFVRNSPWMLTTMVPTLMSADEFVQIDYEDYEDIETQYKAHKGDKKIAVVIDTSFLASGVDAISAEGIEGTVENDKERIRKEKIYKKMIQLLEDLEPETEMEYMTTQAIFRRPMEVFLINP